MIPQIENKKKQHEILLNNFITQQKIDLENFIKKQEEEIQMLIKQHQEKNNPNREKMVVECKICFEPALDCVFIPCGHTTCEICASKMYECPFCKKKIEQRLKIFI